jgi:hypothetical protein
MACDENGLAVFELLREKPAGQHVFLYAFDLLGLNGRPQARALRGAEGDAGQPAAIMFARSTLQRAPHARRQRGLSARLQDRP